MTEIFPDKTLMYSDELPGGAHWSMIIRRGITLRLIDVLGGANVGMIFFNPLNYLERYNAPDSLKCQHTFKLGCGNCLYSDMGRIFCSIIKDDVGWHDTVGGNLSTRALNQKYAVQSYQDSRNDWTVSGEQSFQVELAKYGLNHRDVPANLNLFSRVSTNEQGDMTFVTDNSRSGDAVELRFEMDTLVVMHTCPHPMNPAIDYPVKPVRYELSKAEGVKADDLCMTRCDENRRGFQNNALYHLQGGY